MLIQITIIKLSESKVKNREIKIEWGLVGEKKGFSKKKVDAGELREQKKKSHKLSICLYEIIEELKTREQLT